MNNVTLVGRLVKDVDLRQTQSGKSVASFTIAVNKKFAKEGEAQADFINIVVWGKPAENVAKYKKKGNVVGIIGRLETRSYEKDGKNVWVTEVNASDIDFIVNEQSGNGNSASSGITDDDLPF
jgi:single-strand DNA-binding protein